MFFIGEHGKEVSSVKDLYSKPIDGKRKAIALGLIRKVCREYGYERCMLKADTTNQTATIVANSKGGKDHE